MFGRGGISGRGDGNLYVFETRVVEIELLACGSSGSRGRSACLEGIIAGGSHFEDLDTMLAHERMSECQEKTACD